MKRNFSLFRESIILVGHYLNEMNEIPIIAIQKPRSCPCFAQGSLFFVFFFFEWMFKKIPRFYKNKISHLNEKG